MEHSDQSQDGQMDSIFERVRRIDPAVTEAAVRQYFREIDEVAGAIRSIDVTDIALPVAYAPSWRDEAPS